MTESQSDAYFRQLAEAEDGQCVSAGARMSHLRDALWAGKAHVVHLALVPEGRRKQLIAEIEDLVARAQSESVGEPVGAPAGQASQ